jgi:hypothetical protein
LFQHWLSRSGRVIALLTSIWLLGALAEPHAGHAASSIKRCERIHVYGATVGIYVFRGVTCKTAGAVERALTQGAGTAYGSHGDGWLTYRSWVCSQQTMGGQACAHSRRALDAGRFVFQAQDCSVDEGCPARLTRP